MKTAASRIVVRPFPSRAFGTILICLASANSVQAATQYWTGSGGDGNWNNASNWSTSVVPGSNDIAQFDASAQPGVTINLNISVAGINIGTTFAATITQSPGVTLTLGNSGFVMAAGTFVGGNAAVTVNGPFSMSRGTFRSTTDVLSIHQDFTISGGTFSHNNGTVRLFGYSKTVSVDGTTLKNLIYDTGGNNITVTGTVNVAGDFTLASINYMNSGTISVAGNVSTYDTSLIGYPATVILFSGTGDQTFTAAVTDAEVPSVDINKPSGTLYLAGTIGVFNDWTHTAGAINCGSAVLHFLGYSKTVTAGSMTYGDVVYDCGGNSITTSGTMNVAGAFTINSINYMNGGTISVAGNVTTNDTSLIGYPGTVILFSGAGDQTLTASVTDAEVPSIDINKPSGTLNLIGSIGVFNNWTHTLGSVNCGSAILHFLGYDKTVTAGSMTYGEVLYDVGGSSITTSGTMNVAGTFTIKSINYMNEGTIACTGNVVTKDSNLIGYPGTIIKFCGTGDQTLSANGTLNEVPSLLIDKPSGKLTISDQIGVFNDFTYTTGIVDANTATVHFLGYDKTITSTTGMTLGDATFNTGGNSVTVVGTLNVGNFKLTSANYFQGGTIQVAGNLTSAASTVNSWNGVSLVLNGAADQFIDDAGGAAKFPQNITINKPRCTGGEVKLSSNLLLNQYGQNLTITSGTLNLENHTLTMSGSAGKLYVKKDGILKFGASAALMTISASPELQCGSMVIVNNAGNFGFPGSTVAQLGGLAGNSNWSAIGGCSASDTPAGCPGSGKKIIRWREVPN